MACESEAVGANAVTYGGDLYSADDDGFTLLLDGLKLDWGQLIAFDYP